MKMCKRKKHKALIVCLLATFSLTMSAQHLPARSNYLMTTFMDHPASAGNKDCLDMRMGFRSQWSGFEGAPSYTFASLSGRLGQTERTAQGIGGRVQTDEAGPWGTTSFSMALSQKIQMTNGGWLSAGIAIGVTQHRLNIGKLDFPDVEVANDPAVIGATEFIIPTVDAGFWYQDEHSFLGISIVNATSATLSQMTLGTQTARHLVATTGTSVELDGLLVFRPSAQIRSAAGIPPSVDFTFSVVYDKVLSIGLGYRNQSALVAYLQVALFEYATFGYSYDFGISDLRIASPSSHEITLSLSACDRRSKHNVSCSAYD